LREEEEEGTRQIQRGQKIEVAKIGERETFREKGIRRLVSQKTGEKKKKKTGEAKKREYFRKGGERRCFGGDMQPECP